MCLHSFSLCYLFFRLFLPLFNCHCNGKNLRWAKEFSLFIQVRLSSSGADNTLTASMYLSSGLPYLISALGVTDIAFARRIHEIGLDALLNAYASFALTSK
ncbi:hypothetical protein DFH11DRAFT_1665096 [Phellopilus nigrolimitatus]|nr:hypothetical protein DFH11DRAFT_1665096 [Phellopilus nigrolimitatus]